MIIISYIHLDNLQAIKLIPTFFIKFINAESSLRNVQKMKH